MLLNRSGGTMETALDQGRSNGMAPQQAHSLFTFIMPRNALIAIILKRKEFASLISFCRRWMRMSHK